ncbi:redoxin domain-containing protein [uncultured Rubinisphaera sp.]|uniref:redoxin domain-containing protein n=1 Tax=uncultured Rubinisphaera sp. TaxID=1678686 RepID=UPI0030D7A9E0
MRIVLTLLIVTLLTFSSDWAQAESETTSIETATAVKLPDIKGKTVEVPVGASEKITVLCFLGTECPLARLYGPRLETLSQKYAKDVRFYAINSNMHDSLEEFATYAEAHKLTFPCVKDYENKLADRMAAERTPEVIVLDQAGKVRYQGRIDDQYLPGIVKPEPTRSDLKIALEELIAGKEVSTSETKAVGCLIGKVFPEEITTDITYTKEIAPILQTHCVECHRQGEIGPFALTQYDEVVGWGEMLLEVIDEGRMPPWHANPKVGVFTNARRMSAEEINALKTWVHGGMPYGNAEDLPKPTSYVQGWQFKREPDLVFDMHRKPFAVPEEGIVEYQYFVVDPKFTEDKWVTGTQIVPGNRAVVHHCIVFVRPPDGKDYRGLGWIAGYVPGQRSVHMPEGYARKVPAGSQFVFQMHYTPNGIAQEDLTKLGLLLIDEKDVTHEVSTLVAINHDFEIPPHAADYAVKGDITKIPDRGELLAITPHMHYRGKSFQVTAKVNDSEELLLDVPAYDFNWQHVYELASPRPLASIEKLSFVSTFDNSEANPFNPNPEDYVTWGDQSSEEMAIAFFEVAYPLNDTGETKKAKPKQEQAEDPERQKRVDAFVADFFKRFDQNEDGEIKREELPLSMRRFAFKKLDRDDDGRLDTEEVKTLANSSGSI